MRRNKSRGSLIFLFILIILGYFFVYRPIVNIKAKANIVIASAKDLKSIFAKNDIELLKTKMEDFSNKYQNLQKAAKPIYWASFIPYVSDLKNGLIAGDYLIKAGKETILTIEPYADLIGFKKGEKSFNEKSSEDRLQTAVLTLDKMVKKVDPIADDINQAGKSIANINPNLYPKKIGKLVLRDNITNLKDQFEGMTELFVNAKPLIKKLPEILGSNEEKTYLILYQNDKERRATGGFLTFYAVFKIRNGKMNIYRSDDIYSLDATISDHPQAPPEILTYHKGVSQFYIRDSNLSPDFVQSVKLFEGLYKKSGAKVEYDGIIAMDSKILVDMLTIFGDVNVQGINFSAKINKRCDCPEAIYTLFDLVDRPVGYFKENRKGILGDLMYKLFYNAIGFSPSKYWGTLMQTMFKNLDEKHILVYFKDTETQKSLEQLNFSGRIREYKGDYLSIINVNFAGAKSNMFISENIDSKTNGSSREVTINFKNPYPASDCNLERGGLCLNAILRNWIRLYVPQGSKLVSFNGSSKKVQSYDELGKTVFEGFLEVPTQGQAMVTIKYTLPANVDINNYSLLVQKQAGVEEQKLKVSFDNRTLFDGMLRIDKVIEVN
ncbi:hypothetical protein COS77_01245 [Candidatus Roizmanbacteria bacterium CG06_land_8_20_14_3_00_34_14]|uniref:DUF4012 domain-containing protein n=4 Tax=Candidatus Roizmaniibacteriota TaxID=1752723 RepID=A0A2M7AV53_9BACT|nr:MAG: hypothetical protein COT02_02055 [Candidatus Roizmanbacteria bacterium CG07_land_8_20_14_0_80_34_15]PIU74520.1 MAG: hypothetical protein COS77_01245 [Candidatus Roizmanbacteria bacterium CG06_land_8_20_14_3_00_34_14]